MIHAQRRLPRRGVALLLVLISMATALTLVMGWLAAQDNSALVGSNAARAAAARAAAQSGLDLAAAVLESEAPWQTAHTDGWLLQGHAIADAIVDIRLMDEATGEPPHIGSSLLFVEATATLDGMTQTASALATVHPFDADTRGDLSGYAVWAAGNLQIQGNARVRSWTDSGHGARVLACLGDLHATGRARRDISSGDLSVHIPIGVGSEDGRSVTIPNIIGSVGLPVAPMPQLTHGDVIDSLELPRGQRHDVTGHLSISGDLVMERDAVLHITNASDLTVHGELIMNRGSAIVIEPGVRVRIAVGGDIELSGAVIGTEQARRRSGNAWQQRHINWTDPEMITVCTVGHPQASWEIDRGSLIQGTMHAPGCDVLIDRSTVMGRIAAHDVSLTRNARLFYDHRMDSRTGLSHLAELVDRLDLMNLRSDGLDQWACADMLERLGTMLDSPESARITAPVEGWWVHRPIPVDYVMRRCGGDVDAWEHNAMVLADEDGARP